MVLSPVWNVVEPHWGLMEKHSLQTSAPMFKGQLTTDCVLPRAGAHLPLPLLSLSQRGLILVAVLYGYMVNPHKVLKMVLGTQWVLPRWLLPLNSQFSSNICTRNKALHIPSSGYFLLEFQSTMASCAPENHREPVFLVLFCVSTCDVIAPFAFVSISQVCSLLFLGLKC